MSDTKYCYPDTDVLINKLDIRDFDKLHIFERKLTMLRLLELLDKPINGKFDFKHLQAIHAYIFQDVYDWSMTILQFSVKSHIICVTGLPAPLTQVMCPMGRHFFIKRYNVCKK